jgi:hypothetical protein
MRKFAWLLLYLISTFCWIVLIEHGPDDFSRGCKIEIENFQTLLKKARLIEPRSNFTNLAPFTSRHSATALML